MIERRQQSWSFFFCFFFTHLLFFKCFVPFFPLSTFSWISVFKNRLVFLFALDDDFCSFLRFSDLTALTSINLKIDCVVKTESRIRITRLSLHEYNKLEVAALRFNPMSLSVVDGHMTEEVEVR